MDFLLHNFRGYYHYDDDIHFIFTDDGVINGEIDAAVSKCVKCSLQ